MALNRLGLFMPTNPLAGFHDVGRLSDLSRALAATSSLTSTMESIRRLTGASASQLHGDSTFTSLQRSLNHVGDAHLGALLKEWTPRNAFPLAATLETWGVAAPNLSNTIRELSASSTRSLALAGHECGISDDVSRKLGSFSAAFQTTAELTSAMRGLPSSVAALATASWHEAFENKGLSQLARTIGALGLDHNAMTATHLGSAVRMAAGFAPKSSLDDILTAVDRAHTSLLGTAVQAVVAAFPGHAYIASEALAALSLFELEDEGDADDEAMPVDAELTLSGPLVSALAEARSTLGDAATLEEAAEKAVEVTMRVAVTFEAHRDRSLRPDSSSMITFLTLVLAALQVILGGVQVEFARRAEDRADRQGEEAATESARAKERAEQLQTALDKLVRLQEQEATARGGRAPQAYVVQRKVRMHSKPDTGASQGFALERGAVVLVKERRGKWIRVEQPDHLRGVNRTGWVLKKYLARVER